MAVMKLGEFMNRVKSELVEGIVETIFETDPIHYLMPWTGYAGDGVIVDAESSMGDSDFYGLDAEITSKNPSTTQPATYTATRIIGDAELDGKQVAESESSPNKIMAMEVKSKAKSVGMKLQKGMVQGDGVDPNMSSTHTQTDAGQYIASTGSILHDLDTLGQLVASKNGFVDFYMLNGIQMVKLRDAYRASGGVPMIELTSGNRTIKVVDFNGIPCFTNNFLKQTETAAGAALTGGNLSSIYAGNFDDGTRKVGVSFIHPVKTPAGIVIEDVGTKETKDQKIIRVKLYVNFVNFNKFGLARLTDCAA